MESRNEHLLINFLDRTLEEKEMREMEALINTDLDVRKQWQFLQLAVEAVEYAALYDQVAAVKENFRTVQPLEILQASHKKNIRVRVRPMLSMAASLFVLIIGVFLYKYFTLNATQVQHDAFIPYTLPTTRGQAITNQIEKAYQLQNWNAVIANIEATSITDNKALFLAGMAHLQLQHYAEASMLFQQVIANNTQTGDDRFEDEAEFYWAMNELAVNNIKQGFILLQQIRNDEKHVYHQQIAKIGFIDWQILKIKASR